MKDVVTRFAPSPTGFMHLGNLRSCLYGYLFARINNGKFILRIEDTDQKRYVDGAVDVIYRTLEMTGINYDEGPDKDGGHGPYIQSQRKNTYIEYAKKLVELGGAYYCFCPMERLETLKGSDGYAKYDKHCLHLSKETVTDKLEQGLPYVIRQNVSVEGDSSYIDLLYGQISVPNKDIEDNILIKSDGFPTYNFANVIDDHLMGVTHVIRGVEYLSSTPKYNLLYDAFGWERPEYIHLQPIMRDARHKLSKRDGDAYFDDFIEKGFLPEAIINYVALLGWSPKGNNEILSMQDLIAQFDISGISKSPSIFDETKMKWLNGEYIKAMPHDEFVKAAYPFITKEKLQLDISIDKFCSLIQNRIEVLGDISEKLHQVIDFDYFDVDMFINKKYKITLDIAQRIITSLADILSQLSSWTEVNIRASCDQLANEMGCKPACTYLTLRMALTGKASSPGGGSELADLLGRDETVRRLSVCVSYFSDSYKIR